MFNSRRVQRVEEPPVEALPETPFDQWDNGEDPMAELARLVETDLDAHARAGQAQLRAVEAVAAELEASIAAQHPRVARGRVQKTYDPWDDSALGELPGSYAFEEAEPGRIDDGVLPPHMADQTAASGSSGRRRLALFGAVAAVAVLVAGSGVWWLLKDGVVAGFGEPQIVRAPTAPWKIVPEKATPSTSRWTARRCSIRVQGVPAKKESGSSPATSRCRTCRA